MTLEMGKPIAESKAEITYAAEFLRWFSEEAVRIDGRYAVAPNGIGRVLVSVIGFVACVMVIVGFKAKFSAVMLVVILSIFNIIVNNFWTLHEHHPQKDFAKYDFFQILSIVGGLLLLVNMGPGQFSVDEKKKVY